MFRPLSTVPLPATAQYCLKENGFVYGEDVLSHRGTNSPIAIVLILINTTFRPFFKMFFFVFVLTSSAFFTGVDPEARNLLHQWNLHSNESWHSLTKPPATQNSLDIWQVCI